MSKKLNALSEQESLSAHLSDMNIKFAKLAVTSGAPAAVHNISDDNVTRLRVGIEGGAVRYSIVVAAVDDVTPYTVDDDDELLAVGIYEIAVPLGDMMANNRKPTDYRIKFQYVSADANITRRES